MKKRTGLYGELLDWRLEDTLDDPKLQEARILAEAFAKNPRGWLAFYGSYGVGKSWFMVGIVQRCLEYGIEARYIETENLLQEWKATFSENDVSFSWLFDKMVAMPVLVLDELNEIHGTNWAVAQLTRILHQRYTLKNGTVFGLSKDPRIWMKRNGMDSVLSRLEDDLNYGIIEITGKDRRKGRR